MFDFLGSQTFYNAIIAIATVSYTIGTFVLVSESRKQRKAHIRPIVDMYAEPLGGLVYYATVQNVGNNPARGIIVDFSTEDGNEIQAQYAITMREKFTKANIPHLSPGQKHRYLIHIDEKDFDIDQTVVVNLSFSDIEDGHHMTKIAWNMSKLRGSIITDEVRDFHNNVPKQLEKINATLTKLTQETES